MRKFETKKPQMLQYLRKVQKLQTKNFGKFYIMISASIDDECGVSFDISFRLPDMKEYHTAYFYQFWTKEKNDEQYNDLLNSIQVIGGKI